MMIYSIVGKDENAAPFPSMFLNLYQKILGFNNPWKGALGKTLLEKEKMLGAFFPFPTFSNLSRKYSAFGSIFKLPSPTALSLDGAKILSFGKELSLY